MRQNYIQRRLLITYKTLERLSQSEWGSNSALPSDQQQRSPDRGDAATGLATGSAAGAGGSGKYLSVPRSGRKLLCPDDIAMCTDTIKRFQPKAFTRYDRNMFIVNWLDNIDPQNNAAADDS